VITGNRGAVSAAHPLAVSAGQQMLCAGGNAVDALIAAHAVLCVVIPEACGLGGDALVLVRAPDGAVTAVNGTGRAAADPAFATVAADGNAVTVPGIVRAWEDMNARWGGLSLGHCLEPAIGLAAAGCRMGTDVGAAVEAHRDRLRAGGAAGWVVFRDAASGRRVVQSTLADTLRAIAQGGSKAFYEGALARAIADAAQRCGGLLAAADLAAQETDIRAPVSIDWGGGRVHVQPPMTQGILLAMCLKGLEAQGAVPPERLAHVCAELTDAAFAYRDRAGEGEALLDIALDIDPEKASRRGGARAYLHTAGVAVADAEGFVVSSLISVFDHFGSGVFVPEGGFVLNNRGQGFTSAPNEAGPAKRPVHTLAPALFEHDATALALATPGADGQVQTLLQVLATMRGGGADLASAIHAPRWRSEDGRLIVAPDHPGLAHLEAAGHAVERRDGGDLCFGAVVCAGIEDGTPLACGDWRREVWYGVV
jgi:gamma-glutamyltranspeptidase/glutathione hydrolase